MASQTSTRGLCFGVLVLGALLSGCSAHRFAEPVVGSTQRGIASWYGDKFHGRATASGEIYDMHGKTAAHRDLPIGTLVRVENLDNGRAIEVRINDRGPFVRGRIIDLSRTAAKELHMIGPGTAKVEIRVLEVGEGPGRYPPFGSFRYTVQVGAYREPQNAQTAIEKLRGERIEDAEIRPGKGLLRVQVGIFTDRGEAERMRRKLRKLGWDAVIVGVS